MKPKRQPPRMLTSALLVITTTVSILAREHALATVDASNALRDIFLTLVAANFVAIAFALAPLHAIAGGATNDREKNFRIREGYVIAFAYYVATILLGNVIATLQINALELKAASKEFAAVTAFSRTQAVSFLATFTGYYAANALATLGRTSRANRIVAIYLATTPLSYIATVKLGPHYGPLVDALSGAITVAYTLANLRRWTYEGFEAENDVRWVGEWLVTGLFAGLKATLLAAAIQLVVVPTTKDLGLTSVETAIRLVAFASLPAVVIAHDMKYDDPTPTDVAAKTLKSAILTAALSTIAATQPTLASTIGLASAEDAVEATKLFANISGAVVLFALHLTAAARFESTGDTPLPAISTAAGAAYVIFAAFTQALIDAPPTTVINHVGIGLCVTTIADVALLIAHASYLRKSDERTTA